MTTWFTSDTHFGHKNIIEYCNRPFRDPFHMNEAIVGMWNDMVAPGDIVYHLGDVALGKLDESLPYVGRLNGTKILVPGNHDRVWNHWPHKSPEKRAKFMDMYAEVFQGISLEDHMAVSIDGQDVLMSHLPYDGDSQEEERYGNLRPVGNLPLIHGHIHTGERARNGHQFHVGMDAHSYRPVHEDVIKSWLDSLD
jgi:calcineurin-like phosphoesterase family protein